MSDKSCEVILISGFLGSGKTTFLRRLLSWPGQLAGTVVLVNEFGQIGIDGEMLEGYNTPVFELANGCICCTLQGDLMRSLDGIVSQLQPKRLLVEATGVADTRDILKTFRLPKYRQLFCPIKVVAIVDADYWEARECFGPLFYNQIKEADLVLLNKIDLLGADKVGRYLDEINKVVPKAAVVPTYHCNVDPGMVWGLAGSLERAPALPFVADLEIQDVFPALEHARHEHEHGHAHKQVGFVQFAFEATRPFLEECLQQWFQIIPPELYRIKGHVLFPHRRMFVNHVGGKTEWATALGPGTTKLAFVGWQVDPALVVSQLEACLEEQAARP